MCFWSVNQIKNSTSNENLQLQRFASRLNHIRSANLSEDRRRGEFIKRGMEPFRDEWVGSKIKNLQDQVDFVILVSYADWKSLRLNRILVDYLLRMSYRDTATNLIEKIGIPDLFDVEEFDEARGVISALQRKEVAPALAWCADNKDELNNSKSNLELNLRIQDFIELIRKEDPEKFAGSDDLLTYSTTYLLPWTTTHQEDVEVAMTALLPRAPINKFMFEAKRWDNLVDQFKKEFFKLNGMTDKPLLYIYLQAGLCALKTPFCYKDDCNKKDSMSLKSLRELAASLPFSKPYMSTVCYITGKVMDLENCPMLLPNGYIYSREAVSLMYFRNYGKIICPRTGMVFAYDDLMPLRVANYIY